jgi:hypothetical protein
MTELDNMIESANPVPDAGPGSDVFVPPFDAVWAIAQAPPKSRPRWFGLVGLGTLTVGIVAAVVLGTAGNGPTSAFAAWSATPTKATRGEILAGQQRCHQATPPALVDTRGPFELLLFETHARTIVECHAWPSGATSYGNPQPTGRSPSPNSITIITCNSGGYGYGTASRRRTHVYLQMYGLAGKNVTRVTLKLQGGTTVKATTSHGLWAAWWPGGRRAVSIQARTPTASTTAQHSYTNSNC